MKKTLALMLVVAMTFSLVACGKGETPDKKMEQSGLENTTPDVVKSMVWASGATGGVTYPLAVQCLELIN